MPSSNPTSSLDVTPMASSTSIKQPQTRNVGVAKYITFMLDIPTTLSAHGADMDSIALEEGIQLQRDVNTYVGLVANCDLPFDASVQMVDKLLPLSPSLPIPCDAEFIESDMCLPILSETTTHTSLRPPLSVDSLLPWPTAYHPTFLDFSVLITPEKVPRGPEITQMAPKEIARLMRHIREDIVRREALSQAAGRQPAFLPLYPHQDPFFEVPEVAESVKDEHSDLNDPLDETDAEDIDEEAEMAAALDVFNFGNPSDLTEAPFVKVSYHLSTVKELADPLGFYEELKILDGIKRRSKQRAKDALNVALERARELDAKIPLPPKANNAVQGSSAIKDRNKSNAQFHIFKPSTWSFRRRPTPQPLDLESARKTLSDAGYLTTSDGTVEAVLAARIVQRIVLRRVRSLGPIHWSSRKMKSELAAVAFLLECSQAEEPDATAALDNAIAGLQILRRRAAEMFRMVEREGPPDAAARRRTRKFTDRFQIGVTDEIDEIANHLADILEMGPDSETEEENALAVEKIERDDHGSSGYSAPN